MTAHPKGGNGVDEFIRAAAGDAEALRLLAHKSEAHWGYDEKFMAEFDRSFNVTEEFILSNPTFVLREDASPVAFWGLRPDFDTWELEYFYVSSEALGKGYGKHMWEHLTKWCREHEIKRIHFVTSHQAIGFYEKMGATLSGTSKSMIDGREIPYFTYEP